MNDITCMSIPHLHRRDISLRTRSSHAFFQMTHASPLRLGKISFLPYIIQSSLRPPALSHASVNAGLDVTLVDSEEVQAVQSLLSSNINIHIETEKHFGYVNLERERERHMSLGTYTPSRAPSHPVRMLLRCVILLRCCFRFLSSLQEFSGVSPADLSAVENCPLIIMCIVRSQ